MQRTRDPEGTQRQKEGERPGLAGGLGANYELKGLEGGCVWEKEMKVNRAVCMQQSQRAGSVNCMLR